MRKILFVWLVCIPFISAAQCPNFVEEDYDSFEYTTVCPYILPNTTYQTSPQTSPSFGPNHTGNYHIYLNFQNGYVGPAFSRPYTVCVGGTYRISFYHKDAWGGQNNTTFNIYDANDVLLTTEIVPWTGTNWNHWVSQEITAATGVLRLEVVNNSASLGNNDMVIDDMLLEICQINEQVSLSACELTTSINLFDLFSADMPVGGTWSGPSALGNGYLGTFDPATGTGGQYTYTLVQGGCADPTGTVTVINANSIDLGPDIYNCTAQNVTFDAGPGYDFYEWSNGATSQSITVSAPGTYYVTAGAAGSNLVQNGDFQGGTTAASNNFNTSYVPGTGGSWGLLSNPGQFAIATNPNATHINFYSCGDHTSGTGNMYVANGSSVANTTVWEQTVSVVPNQDYLFSFWATNVTTDPNVSQLQLFVNNVAIGPANMTQVTPCSWTQVNDVWNSGSSTQAVLRIVNQSTAQGGNDFALDDIFFGPYCNVSDTVVVAVANHNLSLTPNLTICEGSTTTLTANATSTTASSFVYHWNNIPDDVATQDVTPSVTTAYNVYATGDDGCNTVTKNVTVTIAPMPAPQAGPDQIVCLGDAINLSGTVAATQNVHGWTHNTSGVPQAPTVTYAPNALSLTPTVTVNQPGTYLFIHTEQNNACGVFKDTVEVLVSVSEHTVTVTDLTCNGNNSGQLEVVNADGVNYSFDNQTTWTTNLILGGLAAGNYTVCSENQHGCVVCTVETINEPPAMTLTVSNDTTVCENGIISMWAAASDPNCDYHWNFTGDLSDTQTDNPLADTQYEVFAENANGCLSGVEQINVIVRPPLSGTPSADETICPGYPTTIGVSGITGGLASYDIQWSSGEQGQGTAMNIQANPPVTTTYTATITDACESTPLPLDIVVTVAPLPIPLMSSPDPSICEPASFTLVNQTDPNSVASLTWILSDGQFFTDQETVTTAPMPAGSYDVQLIVVSPDGCIDSVTNTNYLVVYPLPIANFQWSPNPVQMFNTTVAFQNQSHLGYTYEWFFEEGTDAYSTLENPSVQFPDGETGDYEVTLIAITEHGCMDTITRIVNVVPEVLLFVPNSFTPDGDQFNQQWRISIEGVDIYNFHLQVFNRWGEMVWESYDASVGWDGTYNGQPVPFGTYSWAIEAKDAVNDNKHTWNGHVNVLK